MICQLSDLDDPAPSPWTPNRVTSAEFRLEALCFYYAACFGFLRGCLRGASIRTNGSSGAPGASGLELG
jgi:hypothetical protein